MFHDTQPAPLPDVGGREAWQEFRVSHPGERLALLRQLRDGSVPVQLSCPDGHNLSSSLWSLDDQRQRLRSGGRLAPSDRRGDRIFLIIGGKAGIEHFAILERRAGQAKAIAMQRLFMAEHGGSQP